MRLVLSQMKAAPGKPFQLSGEEEIGEVTWWEELLPLEGPVHVNAKAYYQDGEVYITLRVWGRIHRHCSRCLADFVEAFDHEDMLEIPVPEELSYLELGPIIESGVRLGIDRRPLCRPDCRGICPRCGADLNVEEHHQNCDAQTKVHDPRLAKLKELL